MSLAGGRRLVYAFRPVVLKGCTTKSGCSRLGTESPLQLAGYGVEMAIKNMEYSALDDSQVIATLQLYAVYLVLVCRPSKFRWYWS